MAKKGISKARQTNDDWHFKLEVIWENQILISLK